MKKNVSLLFTLLLCAMALSAQPKRWDVIWARTANPGSITLDGMLNEAAWQSAESITLDFGKDAGIPGSGYRAEEGGWNPSDPTHAVVKFLVMGDSLYIGVTVRDSSIGGGIFNRADGIIMNLRDKSNASRPAPSGEYLWGWISESWMAVPGETTPGGAPGFGGKWGTDRTNYDAATTVQGISSDDSSPDVSYTVEFKLNLAVMGYNVKRTQGDILLFNMMVRDCDWYWPNAGNVTFNRVWIQGPWANQSNYNVLRIHVSPLVTTSSSTVPDVLPDAIIANAVNFANPAIDGKLDEPVWNAVKSFTIRYGDSTIRAGYSGIGPEASGQYQPQVYKTKALIRDTGEAKVRWFYRADTLYLGVEVKDRFVQYHAEYDRSDGIIFTVNDRVIKTGDSTLKVQKLTVNVGKDGSPVLLDYLPVLASDSVKGAKVAIKLGSGTTVDTLGEQLDSGYTIEMSIVLTKLGYPAGGGDKVLFLGMTLFDGDSFGGTGSGLTWKDDYGTRVWWFRETDWAAAAAFCWLNTTPMTGIAENATAPEKFTLLGNYPNPFNPVTLLRFSIPTSGDMNLKVFDLLGREITSRNLGSFLAGTHEYRFDASLLSSGVYFYQMKMKNAETEIVSNVSKMILLK